MIQEEIEIEVPLIADLIVKVPDDFEAEKLVLVELMKVPDGWYTGTTVRGIPHGHGALLFNEKVRYHPKIMGMSFRNWEEDLNGQDYQYYEG